jgi:hypothetical protein
MSIRARIADIAEILERDADPSRSQAQITFAARGRLAWPQYARLAPDALCLQLEQTLATTTSRHVGRAREALAAAVMAKEGRVNPDELTPQAVDAVARQRPWLFPNRAAAPRAPARAASAASAGDAAARAALRSMSDAGRASYFVLEVAATMLGREVDADEADAFLAAEAPSIRKATAAAKAGNRAVVQKTLAAVRSRWAKQRKRSGAPVSTGGAK